MKTIKLLIVLLCFSFPAVFAGEPGPISTERPSFSSSPLALATGFWQLETGYQYTRDDEAGTLKEHTLPAALLRYGFYQNMELQLGGISYSWQEVDELESDGFQDATLGVKWQVNESDAVVPVGLFAGVVLPVGDSEFTADEYSPYATLLWSHSGALDWFGAANLAYAGDLFTLDSAVGISFSLPGETSAFTEYLGTFQEHEGPAHSLNLGASWLLSQDMQFDIHGSLGLNSRPNDYAAGVGLSYRFR